MTYLTGDDAPARKLGALAPVSTGVTAFLTRVEQLVRDGFKGAITLQCPGDSSIRSMEVREYFDLAKLGEQQE